MPRGHDSSQHPARKVGKDAFQQQPYAPQTMGGGAGSKEPPKKKVDTGGKGDDSRKYPQEWQKKSNPDYNKPAPKTNEDDFKRKDKGYPNKVGPVKKEQNPHEITPRKKPDYNTAPPEQKQVKKKTKENLNEKSDTKKIPNDRKNPNAYPSKDDRGDKYKNGWYN